MTSSAGKPKKPKINPFTGEVIVEEVREKTVVVVTGSSTGIGRDAVIEFAKNDDFKVYATMRRPESANFTRASLSDTQRAANLDNIVVKRMDVASDASVERAMSEILEAEDGRIDIVVNNAGYGIAGCLESVSIAEAQKIFDVNVWGAVRVMQAALPSMRKRRSGYIINVSSTSGVRGIPCMEYYSGSKFALEGIADSMRYSLAPYNVSITQVNPGPVRTKFTDTFGVASKGGRGTRPIPGELAGGSGTESNYLSDLATMMVASLERRMASPEAQDSEQVAQIIVHLAVIRRDAKRIEDVPFTIGTSKDSQAVIEAVKTQPTGWGGMYHNLLSSIPPLPPLAKGNASPGSHEEL